MKKYIATLILLVIGFLLIIGVIALDIYLLIVYSNKPITEVPMWVLWFLHK